MAYSWEEVQIVFLLESIFSKRNIGPISYSLYLEFLPRQHMWIMTIFNLWFTFGSVCEAILAYLVLTNLGWRWLVGLSSVPILLLSVAFPFLKESPQYLSQTNREECLALLDKMYQQSGKTRTEDLHVDHAMAKRGSIATLLSHDLRLRSILFCCIWFLTNLVYYGSSFFATQFFLGVVFEKDETSGLLILIVISAVSDFGIFPVPVLFPSLTFFGKGEIVGSIAASVLINRRFPRYLICSIMLGICSLFLLLLLVTTDTYARVSFTLISRAAIFAAFATVYLWTPLTYDTSSRTTAMGLVSSFGKVFFLKKRVSAFFFDQFF